ncbi:MAG: 50S ribosomal protein L15e [Candidatus Hermodarchaeota archaeon]|jgi:large subunit ribosomal protein L15e|nr:50S ribosomal protein L15e [Candidatus Hermodarchaeota archaeon]
MYRQIGELYASHDKELKALIRSRLIEWRKEPASHRVEKPTRLDRARQAGYRAKQGYVVVRQRLTRGSRRKPRPTMGRKPKKMGTVKITPSRSRQWIAEERTARKFPNLRVLGSYYVAEDGKNLWYEIILVDPEHPVVKADPRVNWVCAPVHKGRVFRGLTPAGKTARGLRHRGSGAEKLRPSIGKYGRRGK